MRIGIYSHYTIRGEREMIKGSIGGKGYELRMNLIERGRIWGGRCEVSGGGRGVRLIINTSSWNG